MSIIGRALWSMVAHGFVPFSTNYTTPGTQTISIPTGATTVTVETYASGGAGYFDGSSYYGGGGGAYSKKNTYSVAGLTGIYISIPAAGTSGASGSDAFAKENTSGGTTICLSRAGHGAATIDSSGGSAASGTGDTKRSGGAGVGGSVGQVAGGGAAGTSAGGGNASGTTGGTAGGGDAGAGGNTGSAGHNYGGGGSSNFDGAGGEVVLSWT